MRRYAQLIQDQRYTIETLVAAGWSNKEIAERLDGLAILAFGCAVAESGDHALLGLLAPVAGLGSDARRGASPRRLRCPPPASHP